MVILLHFPYILFRKAPLLIVITPPLIGYLTLEICPVNLSEQILQDYEEDETLLPPGHFVPVIGHYGQ
jgi:hypothetical protein